jgi:hypothetical protein
VQGGGGGGGLGWRVVGQGGSFRKLFRIVWKIRLLGTVCWSFSRNLAA